MTRKIGKISSILALLFLMCVSIFTLSACGDNDGEHIHIPNSAVRENETAATCASSGSYDEVVYCAECSEEISRTNKTIEKLSHTPSEWITDTEATCKVEGTKYKECTKCEEVLETATVDKLTTHIPGAAVTENFVDSDCETEGSYNLVIYCSVCNAKLSSEEKAVEKKPHSSSDWIIDKNATCKEAGSKHKECTKCEEVLETAVIDKLTTHTPTSAVIENEIDSTCSKVGSYDEVVKCSVCGIELSRKEKEISLKDHNPSDWITDTNPTCKTEGAKHKECTVCHTELETGKIDKLTTHTPASAVIENEIDSTCSKVGSYDEVVKCSVCGIELSREEREIGKLPHTEETDAAKAPTCTKTGLTEGKHCSVCNEVIIAQETVKAKGHTDENIDYTCDICTADLCTEHEEEIIPAIAATCTETGLTEGKKCSICGDILVAQETVKANGHTDGSVVAENNVDPDCTHTGSYDNVVYCIICNEELSRETVTVDELGHTEVTDEVVDPTCTETGLTEGKHCSVCNTTLVAQEIVDALGHTEVADEAVEPTCTETGLTEGSHCGICDKVLVKQDIVNAIGHSYKSVITDPTCTEEGYTTHTCHCGDTYKDSYVESTGHTPVVDKAVAPDCTNIGLTEGAHCGVCKKVFVAQAVVPANGHTHSESVVENNVLPDCLNGGRYDSVVYCTVCNTELSRVTVTAPALGHTYNTVVTAPTCTEKGYTTYTCHCGDGYVSDEVAALDHDYSSGICVRCGIHEYLTFTKDYNRYIVNGYIGNPTTVVIPETYLGLPVYAISSEAFKDCTSMTSIVIPSSVTSIGTACFVGCSSLQTMTMPFGDNRTGGQRLVELFGNSLYAQNGGVPTTLSTVIVTDIKEISSYAFQGCSSIISISLPTSLTTIGNGAFTASGITEIIIPENVTEIGDNVFNSCTSLTSITIPNSVRSLGYHVIYSCNKIVEIKYNGTKTQWNNIAKDQSWDEHCTRYSVYCTDGIICKTHTEVIDAAVEPTCTETGLTQGKHCSVCSTVLVAQKTVDALGHTEVIDEAKTPTCTETGLTEGRHCSVCSVVVVAQKVIAARHDYTSSITPPTATDNGVAVYVCSVCGDDYSETLIPINFNVTSHNRSQIGYTGATGENLVIPEVFQNGNTWYRVTNIDSSAFRDCTGLTSISVPDSVKKIGDGAFSGCSSLVSITLPFVGGSANATSPSASTLFGYVFGITPYAESQQIVQYHASGNGTTYYLPAKLKSVTVTGGNVLHGAFSNCYTLESVTLPDSIISVDDFVFAGCSALTEVNIPEGVVDIGISSFASCTSLETIILPNSLKAVWFYAFSDCLSLESITIPSTIFSYAFEGCVNLSEVTILEGGTLIESGAFRNCRKLTSIVIPGSVTSIGEGAFSGCSSLVSITLPFVGGSANATSASNTTLFGCIFGTSAYDGGAKTIQYYSSGSSATYYIPNTLRKVTITGDNIFYGAFYNCTNVVNIALSNSTSSIDDYAFSGSGIYSISLPECLTSIAAFSFANCTSLNSIVIPKNVTAINDFAFENCLNLTDVQIGNAVEIIGNHAFDGCTKLSTISISSSVSSIGDYAFYNCSSIRNITIPNCVKSIGIRTFGNCTGINDIIVPNNVQIIGEGAFSGCYGLDSITLPFVGGSANATSASEESTLFGYIFGTSSYTLSQATTQWCASGKTVTYQLPYRLRSVTITGGNVLYGAFSGCYKLESITLPNTIKGIDDFVFAGCSSLTEVNIPEGVVSIGISSFASCTSLQNIALPDTVKSILFYAFSGCSSLESITVPSSIGFGAFENCVNLSKVTILDGGKLIDSGAFQNCKKLTNIVIPNSVTSIGDGAFSGCSSLASITLPFIGDSANATSASASTLFGYIFGTSAYDGGIKINQYYSSDSYATYYIPESLKSVTVTQGKLLYGAFYACPIENITIGNKVASIDASAFEQCTNLTSLKIGDRVTELGACAFKGCIGLKAVVIPNSVTSIGASAFEGCTNLSSLTIGTSVKSIGESAFSGCSKIGKITIPYSVSSIGSKVFFGCAGLKSIVIPNSTQTIGKEAFSGCSALESITLPFVGGSADATSGIPTNFGYIFGNEAHDGTIKSVVITLGNIYDYAFSGCSIESITLGNGVGSIGISAFSNCDKLANIVIGNGVTSIGENAFKNCTNLISIVIPENVESIGIGTLSGCSSLENMTLPFITSGIDGVGYIGYIFGASSYEYQRQHVPESLKTVVISGGSSIANYAFYGCGIQNVILPDSVKEIENYAFSQCYNLNEVRFGNGVTVIRQYAFAGSRGISNIVIPDSVLQIDNSAFRECTDLESVTIGSNVTKIGSYAFEGCTKLTDVIISDSVKQIGSSAFENCTSLANVDLGEGVSSIGSFIFTGCTSLVNITIPNSVTSIPSYAFRDCTALESIAIGSGVTKIDDSAFIRCTKLNNVVIPNNVTSIGERAFQDCTALTSVTIGNGVLSINDYAFDGCTSLTSVTIPGSVSRIGRYAFGSSYESNVSNVIFENASGWFRSSSSTATSGTSISSSDLTNAQTAAKLLKQYCYNYWKRS